MISALIHQAQKLPNELYKSLTWDRDSEMSDHKDAKVTNEVQVYLFTPLSPWQRGTNENTNRLLREYLPKSTD